MHESAVRLYKAAKTVMGVVGQSNVASVLNLSPQRVKNWESRGVSKEGALLVEEKLGVRPAWLLRNDGAMLASSALAGYGSATPAASGNLTVSEGGLVTSPAFVHVLPAPASIEGVVMRLATILEDVPDAERPKVVEKLATLGNAPDSVKARSALIIALGGKVAQSTPSKRTG